MLHNWASQVNTQGCNAPSSRPLRVGIDLLPGVTAGHNRWQIETVNALAELKHQGEIECVTAFSYGKRYARPEWLPSEIDYVTNSMPGRIQTLLVNWGCHIESLLGLNRLDVVLEMVLHPIHARAPVLLAVADVSWRTFHDQYRTTFTDRQRYLAEKAIREANHLLTLSQTSRNQIACEGCIDTDRISIAYLGVANEFSPVDIETCQEVCTRYGIQPGYIFYAGGINERKNIKVLARAISRLSCETQLVMVGSVPDEGLAYWELNSHRIKHLGYVPGDDLPALYQSSSAFVFPSKLEGFGLPLIEAGAMGVPIVAADTPIFREIADNSVSYFPPDDEMALSDILSKLLVDKELWSHYSQAVKTRSAMYTSGRYRDELLNALKLAAASR